MGQIHQDLQLFMSFVDGRCGESTVSTLAYVQPYPSPPPPSSQVKRFPRLCFTLRGQGTATRRLLVRWTPGRDVRARALTRQGQRVAPRAGNCVVFLGKTLFSQFRSPPLKSMNGCKRIQESLTICLHVCCCCCCFILWGGGGEGWSNTRWTAIPFRGGRGQQQNTHGRFMLLVMGLAQPRSVTCIDLVSDLTFPWALPSCLESLLVLKLFPLKSLPAAQSNFPQFRI